MAGWGSSPQSRQGRPLYQEPLSQKRSVHPSPRGLVVRAGPPSFHGHQALCSRLAWDSRSSQALICPTRPPGLGWDYSYLAGPWPPPLPLAGRGRDPSRLSQRLSSAVRTPAEPHSRGAQQAWMEPVGVRLSRQTRVDTCGSWPHRRQVAAGSQDHTALASLTLLQYLCCTGAVGSGRGLCTDKALRAPLGSHVAS